MPDPISYDELISAKAHAKRLLLAVDGVRGIGIGDGTIRVYVQDASITKDLPVDVDGVPIEPVTVGEVSTY